MNLENYTKLVAEIVLAAIRLDGEMYCEFNFDFLELLQRFLSHEQIDEFARIYSQIADVDHSNFSTICITPFVNRKREHAEFPPLGNVLEAIYRLCNPMFPKQ